MLVRDFARGPILSAVSVLSGHFSPSPLMRAAYWLRGSVGSTSTVKVEAGVRLAVPDWDPYWVRLIASGYEYEPEVRWLLSGLPVADLFIDGGANIGYWTALVGRVSAGETRVVALEPNPSLRSFLEENVSVNGVSARIDQRAISSQTGVQAQFMVPESADAGGHIKSSFSTSGVFRPESATDRCFPVETVRIDDLQEVKKASSGTKVLIKLDVEGSEIDALSGAQRTLETGALVIYEDHGRDKASSVTGFVLNCGYSVAAIGPGKIRPVTTAKEATAVKPNARRGYNFFAWPDWGPWWSGRNGDQIRTLVNDHPS